MPYLHRDVQSVQSEKLGIVVLGQGLGYCLLVLRGAREGGESGYHVRKVACHWSEIAGMEVQPALRFGTIVLVSCIACNYFMAMRDWNTSPDSRHCGCTAGATWRQTPSGHESELPFPPKTFVSAASDRETCTLNHTTVQRPWPGRAYSDMYMYAPVPCSCPWC
jgi:hypothetical protein